MGSHRHPEQVILIRPDDLAPQVAALLGNLLDCLTDDGELDHGTYWHIMEASAYEWPQPETPEWVARVVQAQPGIWTARLCRAMHNRTESQRDIARCGLCAEYANPRKRERARRLGQPLPGFEEMGGALQLHPPCSRCGLSWLRRQVYRLRARNVLETRRDKIPDLRQARGWDIGTRLYPGTAKG